MIMSSCHKHNNMVIIFHGIDCPLCIKEKDTAVTDALVNELENRIEEATAFLKELDPSVKQAIRILETGNVPIKA